MTLSIQVASRNLALKKLEEVISYPGNLVPKGQDRSPPRNIPKANGWNGSVVLTDVYNTDQAVRTVLDNYPELPDRVRALREISPDIECRLYIGLRPFTRDFILFFEDDTVKRLAELSCQVSIEYFDD